MPPESKQPWLDEPIEKRDSEVDEEFGGSWRSRTYGPLIKSPAETVPQDTQQEESATKGEDS